MSDGQGTYQQLARRFEKHQTVKKGGPELLYVTGEQVIERLNTILGFDGWSFEVKDVTILEDEVWALGRMTVYSGERTIVREQAGGQIINRKRGIPAQPYRPAQPEDGDRPAVPAVEAQPAVKGEPIEIANDIKGAVTDCLKKCATLIGVATYLYDQDERREVEAEMRAEQRGGPRPNAPAGSGPRAMPSSGAGASSTAATGSDLDTLTCEECGEALTETRFKDGTNWAPAQLAVFGRRKHSRVLCMLHYREFNQRKRAAEEAAF